MIDRDGICLRIKEARESAGLTQAELASILDVTERSMQLYETYRVPWAHLNQIVEATGCSLAWLIQGEEYTKLANRTFDSLERIEKTLRAIEKKLDAH